MSNNKPPLVGGNLYVEPVEENDCNKDKKDCSSSSDGGGGCGGRSSSGFFYEYDPIKAPLGTGPAGGILGSGGTSSVSCKKKYHGGKGKVMPLGYGPDCAYETKDLGKGATAECIAEIRRICTKSYFDCQADRFIGAGGSTSEDIIGSIGEEGTKGVAYDYIPGDEIYWVAGDDCEKIQDCVKKFRSDLPGDTPKRTPPQKKRGGKDDKKKSDKKKDPSTPIPLCPSNDPDKKEDGGGGNKDPKEPKKTKPDPPLVGIHKDIIDQFIGCMCTECTEVPLEDRKYKDDDEDKSGGGKKKEVSKRNVPLIEGEGSKEDSTILPYLYGIDFVKGQNKDTQQEDTCASLGDTVLTFAVTKNKMQKVLRVFADRINITDKVTTRLFYERGTQYVRITNPPKRFVNSTFLFELVEDYTPEVQNKTKYIVGQYLDFRGDFSRNRIWAINTSHQLVEVNPEEMEIVKTHTNITITTTAWGVSPVGDIVYMDGNNFVIYNPTIERKTILNNVTTEIPTTLWFTTEGRISVHDKLPYQYNDTRLNPAAFPREWSHYDDYAKMIKAYYVHFDHFDDRKVIAVPYDIGLVDLSEVVYDWFASLAVRDSFPSSANKLFASYSKEKRVILYRDDWANIKVFQTLHNINRDDVSYHFWNNAKVEPETGEVYSSIDILEDHQIHSVQEITAFYNEFKDEILFYSYFDNRLFLYPLYAKLTDTTHYSFGGAITFEEGLTPTTPEHVMPFTLDIEVAGQLLSGGNVNNRIDVIDTSGFLQSIDLVTMTASKVRQVTISSIEKQLFDGDETIYFLENGLLKKVDTYTPSNFDVTAAIKRYLNSQGQDVFIEEAVLSYITGFIVNDNFSTVFKQLSASCGIVGHRYYGDGILYLKKRPPSGSEVTYETYPNVFKEYKVEILKEHGFVDSTIKFYKAQDSITGYAHIEGTSDETPIFYNSKFRAFDGYPLVKNIQLYNLKGGKYYTTSIPLLTGIFTPYCDKIILSINENYSSIESTQFLGEVLYPPEDVFYEFSVASYFEDSFRPTIGWQVYEDVKNETIGWFINDTTMEIRYIDNFPTEGIFHGVVNDELIHFEGATYIGNNQWTFERITRGYKGTGAAIAFNDKYNNSGLFILDPSEKDTYDLESSSLLAEYQNGGDVIKNLTKMHTTAINAPLGVRLIKDKEGVLHAEVTTGSQHGSGEYFIAFSWDSPFYPRDKYDLQYLYNTRCLHKKKDSAVFHGANKALHYHILTPGSDIVPYGELWKVSHPHDYTFTQWDYTVIENIFNEGFMLQHNFNDFMGGGNVPPAFSQSPNNHVKSIFWNDYVQRIRLPLKEGWSIQREFIHNIIRLNAWPSLLDLSSYVNYQCLRDVVGPTGFESLDIGLTSETPTELAGYEIQTYAPIRMLFEVLLYPSKYNSLHIYDTSVGAESVKGNLRVTGEFPMWWEATTYPWLNTTFYERIEVMLYLLDQYHLGIAIPDNRKFLLEKYGFGPPFSLNNSPWAAKKINDFYKETLTKYWIYPIMSEAKYFNVLVAEKDEDGYWGDFAIFNHVEVEEAKFKDYDRNVFCQNSKQYTPNLYLTGQQAYYINDVSTPDMFGMTITLVYGPEHPLINAMKVNQEFIHYIIKAEETVRSVATESYAIIASNNFRQESQQGYVIISD